MLIMPCSPTETILTQMSKATAAAPSTTTPAKLAFRFAALPASSPVLVGAAGLPPVNETLLGRVVATGASGSGPVVWMPKV